MIFSGNYIIMINIEQFVFNPFQVNCYVLYKQSGDCIIVDPSLSDQSEQDLFTRFIESKSLKPLMIINTHGHVDHVAGIEFLKDKYSIQSGMHSDDLFLLNNAVEQGLFFGFRIKKPPPPDFFIEHNQIFSLEGSKLEIRHAPGHSPGSIILYSMSDNFVITGDVLFAGSIGRTDLPGGDYNTLLNSIKMEILSMPDETAVYPGHGPATTVGDERRTNPFLSKQN